MSWIVPLVTTVLFASVAVKLPACLDMLLANRAVSKYPSSGMSWICNFGAQVLCHTRRISEARRKVHDRAASRSSAAVMTTRAYVLGRRVHVAGRVYRARKGRSEEHKDDECDGTEDHERRANSFHRLPGNAEVNSRALELVSLC
jgi:hypothetical protein